MRLALAVLLLGAAGNCFAVSGRVKEAAMHCLEERRLEVQRRRDANGLESPSRGDCFTHESIANQEALGIPFTGPDSADWRQRMRDDPSIFVRISSPQETLLQACGMASAGNEPDVLAKVKAAYARRFGKSLDLSRCEK